MGEPAIEVRRLRKSFDKKEAVAGIDLDIAAGSLAGPVGYGRGGEDHIAFHDDRSAAAGCGSDRDQRS